MGAGRDTTGDVLDRLVLLTHGLKAAGVPAALTETVDAALALGALDLADRASLRAGLRATLVKQRDHLGAFDLLFDRYFPLTRPGAPGVGDETAAPSEPAHDHGGGAPGGAGGGDGPAPPADPSAELLARLLAALRAGDLDLLRQLASGLVDAHAGMGEGPATERYHLSRVMRAADLSRLLSDAARRLRTEADHTDAFAARLALRDQDALIEEFRRLIAEEIRNRLTELGDPVAIVRSTRIDEMEVLRASTTELRALRDAVRPLAHKLAARMAQRRRLRARGKLDVRRTVRRSLQHGGVPLEPAMRDRRASKPDVVVLCDISGSVAEFANFTLQLLTALHGELARLRSFVFVDGIAEVTDLLETSEHAVDPRFLVSRPGVVVADGHSDYARVLAQFLDEHLAVVRPSTTVIIAGDARSNHRPSGEAAFAEIAARAKQVLWFNPEPSELWNTTDSRLADYRPYVHAVYEVRTLRQLADAVAELI